MYRQLGDRMKEFYETRAKTFLPRRIPAIIRVDGKAFHTFCRGLEKPFDELLRTSMYFTAKYLAGNIQGAKIAYVQSDEISLLVTDFDTISTSAWFDYEVEKMVSISASMATVAFNHSFRLNDFDRKYEEKYDKAMFDARAFSLPTEEVNNYFLWRQLDAVRNAIQMVGRAHFSHSELENKSCEQIKKMLMDEKGVDFEKLPTEFKRGSCVRKEFVTFSGVHGDYTRGKWILDTQIPLFTEDRNYIWNGFNGKFPLQNP